QPGPAHRAAVPGGAREPEEGARRPRLHVPGQREGPPPAAGRHLPASQEPPRRRGLPRPGPPLQADAARARARAGGGGGHAGAHEPGRRRGDGEEHGELLVNSYGPLPASSSAAAALSSRRSTGFMLVYMHRYYPVTVPFAFPVLLGGL